MKHGQIEVHVLKAPTAFDPEDLALSQAQSTKEEFNGEGPILAATKGKEILPRRLPPAISHLTDGRNVTLTKKETVQHYSRPI